MDSRYTYIFICSFTHSPNFLYPSLNNPIPLRISIPIRPPHPFPSLPFSLALALALALPDNKLLHLPNLHLLLTLLQDVLGSLPGRAPMRRTHPYRNRRLPDWHRTQPMADTDPTQTVRRDGVMRDPRQRPQRERRVARVAEPRDRPVIEGRARRAHEEHVGAGGRRVDLLQEMRRVQPGEGELEVDGGVFGADVECTRVGGGVEMRW